jgi:hypothetical protein
MFEHFKGVTTGESRELSSLAYGGSGGVGGTVATNLNA